RAQQPLLDEAPTLRLMAGQPLLQLAKVRDGLSLLDRLGHRLEHLAAVLAADDRAARQGHLIAVARPNPAHGPPPPGFVALHSSLAALASMLALRILAS